MVEILLKFIWTMFSSVFIVFLCYNIWQWLDKKHGHKTNYQVTYEYMLFTLANDPIGEHISFESWERLKALGADGWEIAETLESDYEGICFILKRETFHKS